MKKLKIESAKNGLMLKTPHDGTIVCQDYPDSEKEAIESFVNFLWTITDLFGPSTNRYSEFRVKIDIVQGDKFESTE